MKPYASALLIGENQVKIEQAASCFCYQKRENRRGIRGKKNLLGAFILYDAAHKHSQ